MILDDNSKILESKVALLVVGDKIDIWFAWGRTMNAAVYNSTIISIHNDHIWLEYGSKNLKINKEDLILHDNKIVAHYMFVQNKEELLGL